MSEVIKLDKQIFIKGDFEKVIDKNFKQLGKLPVQNAFTLSDFFELYNNLFFEIPKEGTLNSHRFILIKTAEYLGANIGEDIDIKVLLDEITSLRQELLDSNKILLDLNKK